MSSTTAKSQQWVADMVRIVRRSADQLTRPLRSRIPIRLIDVMERFVRDYAKLCDERDLAIIEDSSTRKELQRWWPLVFYLVLLLHIGWLALEVNAAYGATSAAVASGLVLFLSIVFGSHQTLQHLQLDVIVRRALLREFLDV